MLKRTCSSIQPGSDLVNIGDMVLFVPIDSEPGSDLWRSDGTIDGTTVVKSFPSGLRLTSLEYEDVPVYFIVQNGDCTVWKSDGTEMGTSLALHACPTELIDAGDTIFFTVQKDESTIELWASDGTDADTRLVWTTP